MYEIHVAGMAI